MSIDISRRSMLKISGLTLLSLAARPFKLDQIDFESSSNEKEIPPLKPQITVLGGPGLIQKMTEEGCPIDGNNGWRAFHVLNNGQTIIGATEMGNGAIYISNNWGSDFDRYDLGILQRGLDWMPVARDIVEMTSDENKNKLLLISDYSINLLEPKHSSYLSELIFPPIDDRKIQTAISLPDGLIIAGGHSKNGGIFMALESQIVETLKYKDKNPRDKNRVYSWQDINYGNEDNSLIRAIKHDPIEDKIYIVGWSSQLKPNTGGGMDTICIDAKTLQKVNHPYHAIDDYGPIPVNTFNVFHENNNTVAVAGCERSAVLGQDQSILHSNKGFVQIWVNGEKLSEEIVNCRRLSKCGGGLDIVSCGPGGIETITINDTKYLIVCMYSKEICAVPLNDVISGKKLEWQPITHALDGDITAGIFRARVVTNPQNQKQEIYASRISHTTKRPTPPIKIQFE